MLMTVEEILEAAHIAYEQATDAPALTDDDGAIRLNILQKIVSRWRTNNATRWLELSAIASLSAIAASTTAYDLPGDYDIPEAFYFVGESKPLIVKKPWQVTGIDGRYVYITGNPNGGYVLNLGWTPIAGDVEIGKAIRVVYYRQATKPTQLTNVLEMSDPFYAVNELVAELFANDDADMYNKFHGDALACLADMRERNDQTIIGEDTDDGGFDVEFGL